MSIRDEIKDDFSDRSFGVFQFESERTAHKDHRKKRKNCGCGQEEVNCVNEGGKVKKSVSKEFLLSLPIVLPHNLLHLLV